MKCEIIGKIDSLVYKNDKLILDGEITVSDGYHTFSELYAHRILLFITLMKCNKIISWKSRLHSDGTKYEGWFIGGMKLPSGDITYHMPNNYWEMLTDIETLEQSPEFDGHTSDDVLKRLNNFAFTL